MTKRVLNPASGTESEDALMRVARALQEKLQRVLQGYEGASNAELTEKIVTVERMAWQIFSAQLLLAAEADAHFNGETGDGTLGHEYGCFTSREYLQRCTLASKHEIGSRINLGKKLRPEPAPTGDKDRVPLPYLAVAARAGAISPQSAKLIAATVNKVSWERPDIRDEAERHLVEAATGIDLSAGALDEIVEKEKQAEINGDQQLNLLEQYATQGLLDPLPNTTAHLRLDAESNDTNKTDTAGSSAASPALAQDADSLRLMAKEWSQYAKQEGTALDDKDALDKRAIFFGPLTGGVVPIHGQLLPEVAASLSNAMDAITSPRNQNQTTKDGSQPAEVPDLERRTPAQKRHDALAMITNMSATASEMPNHGGAPVTVLVETTREALENGGTSRLHGPGSNTTLLTHQSLRHAVCGGAVQHHAKNADGRLVALGTKQRIFNANQRRAIIARDGGCLIPGCATPPAWCEIHHVLPHSEGGETHTDNGVALCWYHHRTLETNGWEIRMNKGVPEVKAPRWIDPNQKWRDPRRPTSIPERRKLFFWNAWGDDDSEGPDGPAPPKRWAA